MTDATTMGAPKRPTFLTVLCILSFIAGVIAIIFMGLAYGATAVVTSGAAERLIQESGDANALHQLESAQSALAEAGAQVGAAMSTILLVGMVLSVVALIGVWFMWKLRRLGFFVYTGAQALGILTPLFFGQSLDLGFMTFVTILFIVLYALNLKHMH